MQPVTDTPLTWSRVLLGIAAVATLFGTIDSANAQSTPNDLRILKHIQPRGERALQAIEIGKAAADETALLDQRWMYEWNGAQWGVASQTLYVYDEASRTEEWQFVWTGSAMMNQSRTTYQLASGQKLVELYEGYDVAESAFYEMDRYTYEYYYDLYTGEPLFLHRMIFETKIGDEWRPIERTTYNRPTDTELVGITDEWAGEDWTPRERFSLSETAQSVVQTEEARTGTGWNFSRRTTFPGFTIESLRDRTDEFMKYFFDYAGLNFASHLYPNYLMEDWNGVSWVPSERKIHLVMDPDIGNGYSFSGSIYQAWVNGQWISEQRLLTTHRMSDNKPVQSEVALFTGTDWVTTLSEVFEYDARADMTRATQQVDAGEGLENSLQFVFLWEHVRVDVEDEEIPGGFALDAAYPNPFNPATSIRYHLASAGPVAVRAYDALGRHVATLFEGSQIAGTHEVTFHADGLSSGTYMIRLDAPGFSQVRMVTLLK